MAKLRHYLPLQNLRELYFALVQSHLNYGILNWGFAAQTNLNCIQVALKKCVRIIEFKQRNEHSNPLFNELKLFDYDNNFKLRLAQFLFKAKNGLVPQAIQRLFQFSSNTATRQDFSLSFPRTELKRSSFFFKGLKFWNENIPLELQNVSLVTTFTNKYSALLASDQGFNYSD